MIEYDRVGNGKIILKLVIPFWILNEELQEWEIQMKTQIKTFHLLENATFSCPWYSSFNWQKGENFKITPSVLNPNI